jgi:hypothetical protein
LRVDPLLQASSGLTQNDPNLAVILALEMADFGPAGADMHEQSLSPQNIDQIL